MPISDSLSDPLSDHLSESYAVKHPCPCCRLRTLDATAQNDVCPECGWEDDGQGDDDADAVRGGANGARSLTEARAMYEETLRQLSDHRDSYAEGGPGVWWAMALRQTAAAGMVPMPRFDWDAEPELDYLNHPAHPGQPGQPGPDVEA
jgi:hypothetical protein